MNAKKWIDWLDAVDFAYQMLAQICQTIFVGGESTGAILSLWLASKYPEIAGVLAYAPAIRLQLSTIERLKMVLASRFKDVLPRVNMDTNPNWQGYSVIPLKAVVQLLQFQRATLKQLPKINQPIMVIQGRHDDTIHPDSGEIILSKVASPTEKSQLHWMENSSHVILLEDELDLITDLTLQFISDTIKR